MCKLTSKIDNLIENRKSIREIAEAYKELKLLSDYIEDKMNSLKPILIEKKVYEIFDNGEIKVEFLEGKQKSYLDSKIVCKNLAFDEIVKSASFTEKSLKEIEREDVIIKAKKILEETTSPSIKVGKLSKEELKKLNEKEDL